MMGGLPADGLIELGGLVEVVGEWFLGDLVVFPTVGPRVR
jgi:hypothetical protein